MRSPEPDNRLDRDPSQSARHSSTRQARRMEPAAIVRNLRIVHWSCLNLSCSSCSNLNCSNLKIPRGDDVRQKQAKREGRARKTKQTCVRDRQPIDNRSDAIVVNAQITFTLLICFLLCLVFVLNDGLQLIACLLQFGIRFGDNFRVPFDALDGHVFAPLEMCNVAE